MEDADLRQRSRAALEPQQDVAAAWLFGSCDLDRFVTSVRQRQEIS